MNKTMNKKLVLLIICVNVLLSVTGCIKHEKKNASTELRNMIMVNGKIWENTDTLIDIQIDDTMVTGEISSTVDKSEKPSKNNQANFEIKGSKYAPYEKYLVVKIEDEWFLFLKEEDRTEYDTPVKNNVSIDYSNLENEFLGELSHEEIINLFLDIANEIYLDGNYENNLDFILENTFMEYGIDISNRVDEVKSGLIIIENKKE